MATNDGPQPIEDVNPKLSAEAIHTETKTATPASEINSQPCSRVAEIAIPKSNSSAKFPLRFVIAALVVATAVHGFAMQVWRMLSGSFWTDALYTILFAAVFSAVVYVLWLYRMKRSRHWRFQVLVVALALTGATSVIGICHSVSKLGHRPSKNNAMGANDEPLAREETDALSKVESAAAESHSNEQHVEEPVNLPELLLWGIVGVLGFYYLFEAEHKLPERFLKQIKIDEALPSRMRHLILPLSSPSIPPSLANGKLAFSNGIVADVVLSGNSIAEDIKALGVFSSPFCNWQQILRAISPHLTSLDSIWILGSNGTLDESPIHGRALTPAEQAVGGSQGYSQFAAQMVRPYLRPGAEVFCCQLTQGGGERGLQFQDYFEVEQSILSVIEKIKTTFPNTRENEIMIDTTGAQKLISIVGAAITFRRQAVFQYVDTAPPHPVYIYEVMLESPPQLGV